MAERVRVLLSEEEVDAKSKRSGNRSVRIMPVRVFIWFVS